MDPFEAFDAATGTLKARLTALSPEQLNQPSNCSGWTVRDLANHVIGGTHRYGLLLRGAHEDQLAATRGHDYVADGAVTSLDRHVGELKGLFGEPGALERAVAHRAGDVTGAGLLGMSVIEQTLHAWDVAVSIGGDTQLDGALCDYVLDLWTGSIDRLRELGFYGETTAAGEGSAQSRLLAYAGTSRRCAGLEDDRSGRRGSPRCDSQVRSNRRDHLGCGAMSRDQQPSAPQAGNRRGRERRAALLAAVTDDLAVNGLVDFSLRRAARAAGTTHKVLLYHFGSAESLLGEAMLRLREQRIEGVLPAAEVGASLGERVVALWPLLADDATGLRVIDQAIGLAMYDPDRYAHLAAQATELYLDPLIELCPAAWNDERRREVANMTLAAMRGFLVEWRTTRDQARIDAGLNALRRALDDEESRK